MFQDSLQTLKIAQGKFVESGESVEKMTPQTKGKTVLVPLTGSMYVPGIIADTDNVIIDIGTGYYAQKVSYFSYANSCSLGNSIRNLVIFISYYF